MEGVDGAANRGSTHEESVDRKRKYESSTEKDVNCSYTAMIAQAIMRTPYKRATLSEIYNFMASSFDILKKRGNGWRNCVRHTLSLNECFVKLNRPENGRSCNWTVHPSYFDSFLRGDYRKRRTSRKKSRNIPQWNMHDDRYMGFQPSNPADLLSYLPPSNPSILPPHHNGGTSLRTPDMVERMSQQTPPPPTITPTSHSIWHSYVSSLDDTPPSKISNAHDSSGGFSNYHHNMYVNEQIQHKHLSTANPSSMQPHFQLPDCTSVSPSSNEQNENSSSNNSIDNTAHAERYARYNRQYMNASFHQGGYSKISPTSTGERTTYEMNCSGERGNYNRSLPYGTDNAIPQPFQMENSCYSGSLTNRHYRTQYF